MVVERVCFSKYEGWMMDEAEAWIGGMKEGNEGKGRDGRDG